MRITTKSGPTKLINPPVAPGGIAGWGDRYLFLLGGTTSVISDVSDRPRLISRGFLNEKGCHHYNIKGWLSLFPSSLIGDYSSMVVPYGLTTVTSGPARIRRTRYRVSGMGSTYFETILDIGQSYTRSCPAIAGTKGSYSWEYSSSRVDGYWKGTFVFETRQIASSRSKLTTSLLWGPWTTSMVAYRLVFSEDYSKVKIASSSVVVSGLHDRFTQEPTFTNWTESTCSVLTQNLSGPPPVIHFPTEEFLQLLRSDLPPNYWGDLAGVAADDAKALNINSSVFLYQLKDLVGAVKALKTALKRPRPKTVAKAYLAWKYGIMQTYRDAQTAVAAIKATLPESRTFSIVRSSGSLPCIYASESLTLLSDVLHYKIFYDANTYKEFEKLLRDWDFWPTATNIWDVIPFSFVVDWFTNVSQFAEYHDRQQYYDTVDVLGVTKSRRTEFQYHPVVKNYVCSGSSTLILYDRWTQSACDPTFLLFKSPDTFHNWAEGIALVLSKRKH